MKKFLSVLFVSALFVVCFGGCGVGYGQYHSAASPEAKQNVRVIPVYIDSSFTKANLKDIKETMDEWNTVFNGQIVFKEYGKFATLEEGLNLYLDAESASEGLVMFNLSEDSPLLEGEDFSSVLAFVNRLRGHMLVVLKDHISTRNLATILKHEFGHALGLSHVNAPSLMIPYYSSYQSMCIDKISVEQAAFMNHLDMKTLSYCSTPQNP